MKYLILFFAFLNLLCADPVVVDTCDPVPGYTLYTVAEGKHDFLPNDQTLGIKDASINFDIILHKSMWWPFNGDNDYYDISKLTGLTDASNANNRSSAMIGWRPYKEQEATFELFAYINYADSSFDFEKLGIFNAGAELTGAIHWYQNSVMFAVIPLDANDPHTAIMELSNDNISTYREIGGWFGGNDTAPNDMCYFMTTTFDPQ